MNILILGGIAESKQLAQHLIDDGHSVIYSIVGLVRHSDLPCEIHVGGFSNDDQDGINGLADYCQHQAINLLIDATHPFADEISSNAVTAAAQVDISCWRFSRPSWDKSKYDNWHDYTDWDDLAPQLENFRRPFFTIGSSILEHVEQRPEHQQWLIRSARELPEIEGVIQINAIGPFDYQDELEVMEEYEVDALVSKDSGGNHMVEKLDAALSLEIPVFVQSRPALDGASRSFDQVDTLIKAVKQLKP